MAKQHVEEKQQDVNELMQVRRNKMQAFIDKGIEPFGRKYDVTHHAQELLDQFETLGEETVVRMAGRLMAVRGHGKASFTVVEDLSGKIQAYFRLDNLGEEKYGEFKLLDIGDIVGVEGTLFKTHRGEITVKVTDFSILAKSLRPLPEKFHGLKDVETRYRQRYLDLIVNPDVRQTFIARTKIIKSIRKYLDDRNFLEVETPVLSPIAGGANARPFITHHNALDIDMYLRIATELYLKRLVVGGLERVYELGRVFRNEGIDIRHNPEFTSIEIYQAYADYNELMDVTEGIVRQAALDACGSTTITYEGTEIDLSSFRRVTMNDAVLEVTGKDFSKAQTVEDARAMADEVGVPTEGKNTIGEIMYEVFDEKVESTLIQPTFVTQYPTEVSPLAKRNKENPAFTDRFEAFVYGRELANGFSELNDPIDQEQRFIDQQKARENGDDEAHMMDHDYITALEYGLPPTGGLGIGIDRLVMFLTDSPSIRDVLLFPTMKPIENQ
ncbi:lysine--tRNA ligase [Megamonas hypermegale]|uniref:Lysine--tRNA ligase n=1 Tax=Megamonas hypermegale TaxID=158847 RepID=A0A239TX60_9FIRM|nr:lysine--tRNA ligase [Megamonas hypermegale]OUO40786.1 lysine--tRNA ligase [Megamonas hypermegale]SNV02142.1 Lysine--tRNA ligase [Megamonas hypermegale]